MEFLIGRSLANNVTNMLLDPFVHRATQQRDLDWFALLEEEPDAGLGNGGLGRLAACFSRLDGDDATAGDGLWAALRMRHVQAIDRG
jgi:glucan phosphorylase